VIEIIHGLHFFQEFSPFGFFLFIGLKFVYPVLNEAEGRGRGGNRRIGGGRREGGEA
jgi:hypothetical protein